MSSPRCVDRRRVSDALARLDGALAVRLEEGLWQAGPDAAVAVWRDGALRALAYGSEEECAVLGLESDEVGYALDAREVLLPFGVAGIGIAVVQRKPRVKACVGANGRFRLRLAHATGLWQLLEKGKRESLSWEAAVRTLNPGLARALREAICACCGEQPWDSGALDAALSDGMLESEAAKRVFRELYPWGLSARPRDLRLLGVAYSPEGAL